MRNWVTIVAGLYMLVIAGLSPVATYLFTKTSQFQIPWPDLYWGWPSWAWIALLAGGPLVLFFVGVDTTHRRLRPRRHILVSAAAAGLALTLLVFAAVTNIVMVIPNEMRAPMERSAGDAVTWLILAACLCCWCVWALAFWRMGERLLDPAERIHRWLIAGSILELLIAVPSHVIVRKRGERSDPMLTGFGVATGLAILLMSLGPGALFLYRARMRRLSPRGKSENAPPASDALR